MKLVYVRRKTKIEKHYDTKMGILTAKVTYIKRYFMGLPFKTMHKYRETYHGKVEKL